MVAAMPYLALFVLLLVFGSRLKSAGSGAVAQRLSALRSSVSGRRSRWSLGALRVDSRLAIGLGGFVLAVLVPLAVPGPRLNFMTRGSSTH